MYLLGRKTIDGLFLKYKITKHIFFPISHDWIILNFGRDRESHINPVYFLHSAYNLKHVSPFLLTSDFYRFQVEGGPWLVD